MKRALVVIALVACRGSGDSSSVDAPLGPQARVATFNVLRFFDTVCDSGSCESGDYEVQPTAAYFETRADVIAEAIGKLDADVIALQEVESQACVDALLVRLPGMYGVLGEIGDAASVDVVVLSKTPIEQVLKHRATTPLVRPDGSPTMFARELLEVHVRVESTKLVMFAAHFRSKSNDDPGRRLAEAQAAGQIVAARGAAEPAAIVVLAGDLNDVPGSPPINALTVDAGLIRVADDLPVAQQATYIFDGRGQSIDHVLLAPTSAAARVPRSSRVWRDGTGWGGSDHAALTSELALR